MKGQFFWEDSEVEGCRLGWVGFGSQGSVKSVPPCQMHLRRCPKSVWLRSGGSCSKLMFTMAPGRLHPVSVGTPVTEVPIHRRSMLSWLRVGWWCKCYLTSDFAYCWDVGLKHWRLQHVATQWRLPLLDNHVLAPLWLSQVLQICCGEASSPEASPWSRHIKSQNWALLAPKLLKWSEMWDILGRNHQKSSWFLLIFLPSHLPNPKLPSFYVPSGKLSHNYGKSLIFYG